MDEDEELDARVGEARLDGAPAREAEDDHSGEVGVVELVDRDVALVDQDVAVAVDHPVGRLAVRDTGSGALDHQHLGLDVLRGVPLRPPDHLERERDQGRAEEHYEERHDPRGAASVALPARPVRLRLSTSTPTTATRRTRRWPSRPRTGPTAI